MTDFPRLVPLEPCHRCSRRETILCEAFGLFYVMCEVCCSIAPVADTKEEAVTAWNKKQRSVLPESRKALDYEH